MLSRTFAYGACAALALFSAIATQAAPDAKLTTDAKANAANSVRDRAANEHIVMIGTGGVSGVYYPAGGAVCRFMNRGRKEHGIRCLVESTSGSVENIQMIRHGDIDFAVVQSDWQYHALKGTSSFSEVGPYENLRSVFSLHSEPFTIVARKDANIKTFTDLKNKRVNVGSPGSGSRATMEVLMRQLGWRMSDFRQVTELKATEQGQALCDNKIDAFVHATGHPNGLLQEVTTNCETVIVPIAADQIAKLVETFPFYSRAIIPGGMYAGNAGDITSFGVKATLVTSAETSAETVYQLAKSVFENFDNFRTLHPVFATLDKASMISDGNTALLHEGARRYYAEAGLLAADAPDPNSVKNVKDPAALTTPAQPAEQ